MNEDNEQVTMCVTVGDDGGYTQALSDVYKSKFRNIFLHDDPNIEVTSFFKDDYLTSFKEDQIEEIFYSV